MIKILAWEQVALAKIWFQILNLRTEFGQTWKFRKNSRPSTGRPLSLNSPRADIKVAKFKNNP